MTFSLDSLLSRFSCLDVSSPPVQTSPYVHLPKELVLHIARVDSHQQFFFAWRALCRTTRHHLPLGDVVYTSAFRSVGAVKVAKLIFRLLKQKERDRARLFLHRFITERDMAMQEIFITKLLAKKVTKQLFYAELSQLVHIRYLLITSETLRGRSLSQFAKLQSLTISLSGKRTYPLELLSQVRPHTLRCLKIVSDVHPAIAGLLIRSQLNLESLSFRSRGISPLSIGMLTLDLIQLRHVQISLT